MEVIFEFKQIGQIVKVTAIDCQTGMEATIQGPASAGKALLQQNAAAKLAYLIRKETGAGKV